MIAAALAVVGVGALGAWQWQHGQRGEPSIVAAAPAAGKAAGTGAAASRAVSPAASGTAADARVAEVASAPQAAVIVADDTTRAEPALTSSSATGDADRLSRALTSGAAPGQAAAQTATQAASIAASAPAVTAAAASAPVLALPKQASANKRAASRPERESAKNRRTEKLAAAQATKRDKRRAGPAKDDPDADLLAALVARTKPYDAKAPRSASAAAAAKAAQPGAKAQAASLSDQLKACEKGNFFEAQACHWRVCSGHWGKDAACPSAAPASATQSNS